MNSSNGHQKVNELIISDDLKKIKKMDIKS